MIEIKSSTLAKESVDWVGYHVFHFATIDWTYGWEAFTGVKFMNPCRLATAMRLLSKRSLSSNADLQWHYCTKQLMCGLILHMLITMLINMGRLSRMRFSQRRCSLLANFNCVCCIHGTWTAMFAIDCSLIPMLAQQSERGKMDNILAFGHWALLLWLDQWFSSFVQFQQVEGLLLSSPW